MRDTHSTQISVDKPDLSASGMSRLAEEWRDLESRSRCSFFQTWSWVGCKVAERFDNPRLVRATRGSTTVGFALFNQAPQPLASRTLWLHQSGCPKLDSIYIEHNAPLIDRDHGCVAAEMLRHALENAVSIRLAGVDDSILEISRSMGVTRLNLTHEAPYSELRRHTHESWRASLGSSTRSQLGRSIKRLQAAGAVTFHEAEDVEQGLSYLEGLARLHTLSWQDKGKPGAFAQPAFLDFHTDLIRHALPRGEVALWCMKVGAKPVGFLYNFHHSGVVSAYQSGFDTHAVDGASPGLTLHAHAIAHAIALGMSRYDFLAGDARYKRSLGSASQSLHWLELARPTSLRGRPLEGLELLANRTRHILKVGTRPGR